MELNRTCKTCQTALTTLNAVKKGSKYFLSLCKPCKSKYNTKKMTGNPKRQAYMRKYIREKGIVKQYPCETCQTLCYKKYARAFCNSECRFWAYVDKSGDCWIWTGYKTQTGYGKLCFNSNKVVTASRVSYELFYGPIQPGMLICHSCDNPSCVNPNHLWQGTHMENMMDMVEKGRQNAKLLPIDVYNIRKLWDSGYSQNEIIKIYDVSSSQISNITARRIWKHI